MDADGGDLAFSHGRVLGRCPTSFIQRAAARQVPAPQVAPNAGEAGDASGRHAKLTAKPDQRFFHQAHEVDRAQARALRVAQAAQVEDRVADELPRPVIGHVPAAVDLVEGNAARGQQLIGRENVGAPRVAAQREHGRVLEQQQHVADAPRGAQGDEFFLQAQRFAVVHAAEIEILNHKPIAIVERRLCLPSLADLAPPTPLTPLTPLKSLRRPAVECDLRNGVQRDAALQGLEQLRHGFS